MQAVSLGNEFVVTIGSVEGECCWEGWTGSRIRRWEELGSPGVSTKSLGSNGRRLSWKGDVTLGKVTLFSQSASKNKRLTAEAVLAALPEPRGMDPPL